MNEFGGALTDYHDGPCLDLFPVDIFPKIFELLASKVYALAFRNFWSLEFSKRNVVPRTVTDLRSIENAQLIS